MLKKLLFFLVPLLLVGRASAQTPTPTPDKCAAPSYSSTTGLRFSYYDSTLTETTNLGIRATGCQTSDVPGGFWIVFSVDATPKSQASYATGRLGGKYFLKPVAGGNVIAYANLAAGATVSTSSAISSATTAASSGAVATSSSVLANLQGGMGFIWRACHTFDKLSKVNCIVDLNYELETVPSLTSTSSMTTNVKPIVGLYVGLAF
jgi:hypothetical protein